MAATIELILAYRAGDAVEARAIAGRLEDAGIEVQVLGEFLQGAYAGIQIGEMGSTEVWISAAERAKAEAIIAEWKKEVAARTLAEKKPAEARTNSQRAKLQFSTAAMLWLMTVIAILAAVTSSGAISIASWPGWLFNAFVLTLMLQIFFKGAQRVRRSAVRCMREIPEPDVSSGQSGGRVR